MSVTQENSLPVSGSAFDRLRRYQVTEGLTWREVGERLGISVSTIMAVKSQNRSLGPKALYRLEEAERAAAERRSNAEQVVESLLEGEGSARDLIENVTSRRAGQGVPVHYVDARRGRGLPQTIKLVRPSGEGCRRLQKLYADTLDSSIVLLGCLPPDQRTEAFLGLLTPATRSALQSASLELVFGEEWRSKLAALAVADDRGRTKG
jgi:transcriptional regulator with XRE-family HTH domain